MPVIKIPLGPRSAKAAEWLSSKGVWFTCYRSVDTEDYPYAQLAFIIDDELVATEFALRWLQ